MLTPELVRCRRRGGELQLTPLSAVQRARAGELAEALLSTAAAHVGRSREELERAWSSIETTAQERKLMLGLLKTVEDHCEFASETVSEPLELRSRVFLSAAKQRQALGPGERFDRQRALEEAAAELELDPTTADSALYCDLRGAQTLLAVLHKNPAFIVESYERAERQAVLLRAVKVSAEVRCARAEQYRALFRKLKFRRLLYRLTRLPDGGYRIELDGPYSLFESVTKYGLQLALVLPALEACDSLSLVAELHWGKAREPLLFRLTCRAALGPHEGDAPALLDDVESLVKALSALESPWRARSSERIIELPGVGLCVPDLELEHGGTGEVVYLEVLGFWSRDAVWRRVELVEQGLCERVLFAVKSRLRVSEDVIDDSALSALYVYKNALSARAVLERVEELSKRRAPGPAPSAGKPPRKPARKAKTS